MPLIIEAWGEQIAQLGKTRLERSSLERWNENVVVNGLLKRAFLIAEI